METKTFFYLLFLTIYFAVYIIGIANIGKRKSYERNIRLTLFSVVSILIVFTIAVFIYNLNWEDRLIDNRNLALLVLSLSTLPNYESIQKFKWQKAKKILEALLIPYVFSIAFLIIFMTDEPSALFVIVENICILAGLIISLITLSVYIFNVFNDKDNLFPK